MNNRVLKVAANGTIGTVAGSGVDPGFAGDGRPATAASLANPEGVGVDSAGNMFIAEARRPSLDTLVFLGLPR